MTKDWYLLRIDTLRKVKQEMRISVDTGWSLFFLLANSNVVIFSTCG